MHCSKTKYEDDDETKRDRYSLRIEIEQRAPQIDYFISRYLAFQLKKQEKRERGTSESKTRKKKKAENLWL
jgi:hypothetical protein